MGRDELSWPSTLSGSLYPSAMSLYLPHPLASAVTVSSLPRNRSGASRSYRFCIVAPTPCSPPFLFSLPEKLPSLATSGRLHLVTATNASTSSHFHVCGGSPCTYTHGPSLCPEEAAEQPGKSKQLLEAAFLQSLGAILSHKVLGRRLTWATLERSKQESATRSVSRETGQCELPEC